MILDYQNFFDVNLKSPSPIQSSFMSFRSPCVEHLFQLDHCRLEFVFQSKIHDDAKRFFIQLLLAGIPV